ncbi:hypothetical protein OGZ51_07145 [Lactococcus lactis]|uniref:FtsK domain-containing protein n=1 Tax=Lactococcus lactis TaxID=1358 RepID=A0A9X4S636_9LACT|nr:FtsK/SpoIIIE domain-containing protein [Lactococcus lactis]MDG4983916.1 hypothetical protein [Lactococcus lactis]
MTIKELWKFHRVKGIDKYDLRLLQSGIFLFILAFAYFFYETWLKQSYLIMGISSGVYLISDVLFVYFISKFLYIYVKWFRHKRTYRLILHYVLEHNLFRTKKIKSDKGMREKRILSRVYVRFSSYSDIIIKIEREGNRFDEQLDKLVEPFEKLFLSDLKETYTERSKNPFKQSSYIVYVFSDNREAQRISVLEVIYDVKQGIELMRGLYWDFVHAPHLIVTGGTGSGKSILLFCLLKVLPTFGSVEIGDPKKADLAMFDKFSLFKGHVASEVDEIIEMLERTVVFMEDRYRKTGLDPDQKIGKNFQDYDLAPHFLIIDEWVAFASSITDFKAKDRVDVALTQLVLKGRQAGIFLILAMQRADGTYLPTNIRDNMMGKLALGKNSRTGYRMMFGADFMDKAFVYLKGKIGRGYQALDGEMPSEFYSPNVPFSEGYTFEEEFSKLEMCQKGQENLALMYGEVLDESSNQVKQGGKAEPTVDDEDSIYTINFDDKSKEKSTQEPVQSVELTKEEIEEKLKMGEWINKTKLSEELQKTKPSINHMKKAMIDSGYHFVNATYYTKDDLKVMKELFERKEKTGMTYLKLAENYFSDR